MLDYYKEFRDASLIEIEAGLMNGVLCAYTLMKIICL